VVAPTTTATASASPKLEKEVRALTKEVDRLTVTVKDGQREVNSPEIKEKPKPKDTGTKPKVRPASISTSDEEYAPAKPVEKPLVPYPRTSSRAKLPELSASATTPREVPPKEKKEKRPEEAEGFIVHKGFFTVDSLEAVSLTTQFLPFVRAEPPRKEAPPSPARELKAALRLPAERQSVGEAPPSSEKRNAFRPISPRTAAALEEPIQWADDQEEEADVVVVSEETLVPEDEALSRSIEEAQEAVELLTRCQSRFIRELDDAIASLSYVVDLTCLSEWQGHFRGNWELRKILLEAITSYRRAAYRCHVFLEAGLLDVQGTSRVSWQLSKCRELLRTLDLPLLIIDGEDLNGWASYDPPRAMDPLIKARLCGRTSAAIVALTTTTLDGPGEEVAGP
jgi:hypothetical protein